MKNSDQNRDRAPKQGKRGHTREWTIALFGLLMATALPALVAMMAGIGAGTGAGGIHDGTMLSICRHETGDREEQTLGRLIALSLAATNESDTPAASWEAQAILLRSRGVWWLDYCEYGDGKEEKGSSKEERDGKEEVERSQNEENGGQVTENGENAVKSGRGELHILCDSPSHGLPYQSYDELVELWGKQETDARLSAANRAVELTHGQVLCYEGEVVPALLHHSSGGVTRSVECLPWLAAVATPEDGREAVCTLTSEEARHLLAAHLGVLLPSDLTQWALTLHSDRDGRATTVELAGESLSGDAFANALSLPSTTFSVEVNADSLTFICRGEGSGCGLSREGAAIYASGGLTCGEILAHYYPDCTVGVIGGR